MGNMNWTRVILGGLVAGLIINIFEYVLNGVVLAKDMEAAITALGRQMGGGALLMFSVWGILVAYSQSGSTLQYVPATVPVRRLRSAPVRWSGPSGISWLQSPRLRCIFSPDISWPSALQWGWSRLSPERLLAPGSTAKRPPDSRKIS